MSNHPESALRQGWGARKVPIGRTTVGQWAVEPPIPSESGIVFAGLTVTYFDRGFAGRSMKVWDSAGDVVGTPHSKRVFATPNALPPQLDKGRVSVEVPDNINRRIVILPHDDGSACGSD